MLNVTDDAWWSSVPNGNEHGGKHLNVTPRGELLLVTSNHGCQNEQCMCVSDCAPVDTNICGGV